ncbi:MAG: amino acid-binding protein [Sulfurovum sp.]|nr:MAG: amino acid-binding protein [Sulfurovum sp.]
MWKYKIIIPILILTSIFFSYFSVDEKTFEGDVIKLGLSLPQSGIMRNWGDAVYAGADSYFRYANEHHLLTQQIELLVLDDKYEPELTLENVKLLQKKDIFAFFAFVGTPTTKKILPLINTSNIPFIAPFTGASFLRHHASKNIVNFRSSYQDEINAIVQYLYEEKGIKKFAVFYQNDDYGEEGYVSLLNALQERNLTLKGEGTYKRNTLSIHHAFREIKESNPEAILMIGANKANALFIQTSRKNKTFKDTLFCNISFGNADAMVKGLNNHTDNLLFSQVVPYYKDSTIPVVEEYLKLMHHYGYQKELGFISLEAFLAAKSTVTALKSIKGTTTRKKFIQALSSLPENSLEGLKLNYINNQLLNSVYLYTYEDGHFKEVYHEN